MKLPTFPKIYNVYFVALIATVGGMLFGFDISSMSAIIGTDQYIEYFDNPHGARQGAINSALAAGSVVGSLMAGPISDKIGRRDSIMFASIWWLVGTAIQAGVSGFGTLMAGRVLNGVCVGITSSQVPVYLAEISQKEKRGSLIVIQQLAIEWGILIMFFIGYGCSFIPGPSSFRLAWGLQFVPCVIMIIGLPFLPRSPRWLAKVNRAEEAILTLARIQANGNVDDPLVVAEWEEITTVLAAEREALPGWRKFVYNGMWRRTMAGFTVQAWQQLSGANVMTYYVVYIFQMARYEDMKPNPCIIHDFLLLIPYFPTRPIPISFHPIPLCFRPIFRGGQRLTTKAVSQETSSSFRPASNTPYSSSSRPSSSSTLTRPAAGIC